MSRTGGQTFGSRQPRRWLIEVAYGAQHHHPIQINAPSVMKKAERLQNAGIFHSGSNKIALAIGMVADPLIRSLIEQLTVPESGGGKGIALKHERRAVVVGSREVRACRFQLGRIVQLDRLRLLVSPFPQARV